MPTNNSFLLLLPMTEGSCSMRTFCWLLPANAHIQMLKLLAILGVIMLVALFRLNVCVCVTNENFRSWRHTFCGSVFVFFRAFHFFLLCLRWEENVQGNVFPYTVTGFRFNYGWECEIYENNWIWGDFAEVAVLWREIYQIFRSLNFLNN